MNCGISLVNVRNLIIFIPEEYYRSPLSAVLESAKAFDLTRIFPTLTQVRITFGHTYDMSADNITEFGQRGRSLFTELKVTQAVNIKHLDYGLLQSSGCCILITADQVSGPCFCPRLHI